MLDTTTAELDATVAGPVLEPGDPGYAEEVASFSLTFSAAPAGSRRCARWPPR